VAASKQPGGKRESDLRSTRAYMEKEMQELVVMCLESVGMRQPEQPLAEIVRLLRSNRGVAESRAAAAQEARANASVCLSNFVDFLRDTHVLRLMKTGMRACAVERPAAPRTFLADFLDNVDG
jgi:hypothetical protein